METNVNISAESELGQKAAKLLEAGYDYWAAYQRVFQSGAVVWLEGDNGHFILFTRSEYKNDILQAAKIECAGEPAMFEPFSSTEKGTP